MVRKGRKDVGWEGGAEAPGAGGEAGRVQMKGPGALNVNLAQGGELCANGFMADVAGAEDEGQVHCLVSTLL